MWILVRGTDRACCRLFSIIVPSKLVSELMDLSQDDGPRVDHYNYSLQPPTKVKKVLKYAPPQHQHGCSDAFKLG